MKIEKLYCDICGKEINHCFGSLSISNLVLPSDNTERFIQFNEICYSCAEKIHDFIYSIERVD